MDRVNDGSMPPEQWEASVKLIESGVDGLRSKLLRVQKKKDEVISLREGVRSYEELLRIRC